MLSITLFLGAPVLPQGLWPEQELQLWSEVKNYLTQINGNFTFFEIIMVK